MLTRNAEGVILVVILVLAGLASWWLMLRPVAEHDATRFDRLPSTLRGWEAIDVEMDESVSKMLAADHNVQRAYHHDQGYVVFVYVGYYGTKRGGTPEHTPDVCYPAQGWEIFEAAERRIGGAQGFTVQEFLVEKEREQRLVHFWYRTSHATGITSVPGLRLEHFWGRLARSRADGALIRLSTIIDEGDVASARLRLIGMDAAVEGELEQIWMAESDAS